MVSWDGLAQTAAENGVQFDKSEENRGFRHGDTTLIEHSAVTGAPHSSRVETVAPATKTTISGGFAKSQIHLLQQRGVSIFR